MKTSIFILLIIISSCSVSEKLNEDNSTNESIKGRWELMQVNEKGFIAYSGSNTIYIFDDTTFKNINYWFSDVEAIDSCGDRSRINYSKGTYIVKDSVLYLEGVYTDKTFNEINRNTCALIGTYKSEVDILQINDTLILEFMIKPKYNLKQQIKFVRK